MIASLTDLIPEDHFLGTSLILPSGERYLFGMRPPKPAGENWMVEMTGIGGGLEVEDASYAAGVLREAQEEIGCAVQLLDCRQTLVVHPRGGVERVTLVETEGASCRPAAVVFRNHRTPAHQPWHPHNAGRSCLLVFGGNLEGDPQPTAELPWLIWLSAEQILETALGDVRLGTLLQQGAALVTGERDFLDLTYWTRLTDSQEALALALGQGTPTYYHSLLKNCE